MSWICPWCGFENYQMPLNSRHEIFCKGCGKDHTTPEEAESMIKHQIEAEEADRLAKTRLDIHQKTLPFEEVSA